MKTSFPFKNGLTEARLDPGELPSICTTGVSLRVPSPKAVNWARGFKSCLGEIAKEKGGEAAILQRKSLVHALPIMLATNLRLKPMKSSGIKDERTE